MLNQSYLITFALAVGCLVAACGRSGDGDDALGHHHHDHAHAATSSEITLEPEMAAKFGLEVEEIQPSDFSFSITVSGQIVDTPNSSAIVTAPTSGIVRFARGIVDGSTISQGSPIASISAANITGGDANAQAKAALDAAEAELERITPLYESRLVTARAYTDAQQAYKQAKAAYSQHAAAGQARSPIAGVITGMLVQEGQFVDAGAPIASVSSLRSLTLRADLPQRYRHTLAEISGANVVNPVINELCELSALGGKRIANANAASAQRGYIPVYFTFDNNGEFVPGEYVTVHLLGSKRTGVLAVPITAISEQQGAYFVYRQLDEECYEKQPVRLGATDGKRVEILAGITSGDKIVTNNVVAVRLAETSSVAPEGHSH